MTFLHVIPILCLSLFLLSFPTAQAQIRTPCSASMLSSFAPCVNFINGTGNGTRPTPGCCSSLSSMMSNGTDCLCQIFNGNVPFPVPINRTLAISLPRACNMPGVPLQCRAAGAPTPTPTPTPTPGPALSPESPLSPTPGASTTNPEPVSPALTPESDSTPSTPGDSGTPTTGTNAGSRPSVDPSAAERSHILSPTLLLAVLGALALKNY